MKLKESELNELNQLKASYDNIALAIGRNELQYKQTKQMLLNEFNNLQDAEQKAFEKLNLIYGEGSIDRQTGEFTPSEEKKEQ